MSQRGAYESVVVTAAMQQDYVERVLPCVEAAAWTWFPGRRGEDRRQECAAIAWKRYLMDVAKGNPCPEGKALAHYARLDVAYGRSVYRPGEPKPAIAERLVDPSRLDR